MKAEPTSRAEVVVARSSEGNAELAAILRRLGVIPVPVDTVEFVGPSDWSEVDDALTRIWEYDWVVLTSKRGASLFAGRMKKLGVGPRGGRPKIAVVGEMTAGQLKKEGIKVGFVPSEYTTSALARQLPLRFGRRALLLRADMAEEGMSRILQARGFSTTTVPIYHTIFIKGRYRGRRAAAARGVILGSPSEVEGLQRRLRPAAFNRLKANSLAFCIGPVTAKAAKKAGFANIVMPRVHTFDALLMEVRGSVAR